MTDYHEPPEALPADVRDMHRALTSLREEIEAVDWYHQRVAMCSDPELAAVLAHNRDEEIEHAAMTLEWIRRHVPAWDRELRQYLFTDRPIVGVEADVPGQETPGGEHGRGLGIGSRRPGGER